MLVKYLRVNGVPVGCVVALHPSAIGFMVAHPKLPTPSKKFMRDIAIGRAIKVAVTDENVEKRCANRFLDVDTPEGAIIGPVAEVVKMAIEDMANRAKKYYKAKALEVV